MTARSSASAHDQFANSPDFIKTSLGCENLVPSPSHTTSGETSVRAPQTVAERAGSFRICLAKSLLNLGEAPTSQQEDYYINLAKSRLRGSVEEKL